MDEYTTMYKYKIRKNKTLELIICICVYVKSLFDKQIYFESCICIVF